MARLLFAPTLALLLLIALAHAQPAPAPGTGTSVSTPTTEQLPSTAAPKTLYDDFKGGKYREGVAGLITLVLFLWRRFLGKLLINKIPSKALPVIAACIGLLTTIPAALTAQGFSWSIFVFEGLLTSGEAVLFWSGVGKFVLPKVFGDIPDNGAIVK